MDFVFDNTPRFVAEQLHHASAGMQRDCHNAKLPASKVKPKKARKTKQKTFKEAVHLVFGSNYKPRPNIIESLDGMATPSGAQPDDLFAKFSKALEIMGTEMGVGPLQNKLKERGIRWKKSNDGLNIILFVMNAATKAPQPLATISSETLDNPTEFQEQLTNIIDMAKGQAPGSFAHQQEVIRQQEKVIRDIAQSVSPKEPEANPIQQQFAGIGPSAGAQAAQTAAANTKPAQPTQPTQPTQSKMQPVG
jgi:hypothetical protein